MMDDTNLNTQYPWLKKYPSSPKWDSPLSDGPVYKMLDETAAQYPDAPAFDFLGAKQSWGEMNVQTKKLAKGLQDIGVTKGTKVGIFLPNCPLFVVAYYALMRIGATVINYNPLYAIEELENMIEDSDTDIIITVDLEMLYNKMSKMLHNTRLEKVVVASFTNMLPFPKNMLFKYLKSQELAKISPNKRVICYETLMQNKGDYASVDINPEEDVALFQYTGGTTGTPKGAMLTHRNIVANTEQSSLYLGCGQAEDRMLGILPFFHVFAMTVVMNVSVKNAMEIIALPRFELDATLKLIHTKKPTIFPTVPAILSGINNNKKLGKYDLSSIKSCLSGGAPLPVEVKAKFKEKTGCDAAEGYGLTESSPVLCGNPPKGEDKAGSIGLPLPQTIIELIDHKTGKHVGVGERGELCVRGPQVMKGYWNRPEENKQTLQDNGTRLHTGDVAIMDEDGYFYIVDRIKDMIITNGYNVYPRNVEEAIYKHPSVEEVIVAGLPDRQRGEIVKAWIKRKEGRNLTIEDLKTFLADKISPMELPKRIEFRENALPKTMIGKLSRKDVVAQELENGDENDVDDNLDMKAKAKEMAAIEPS